MWGKKKLSVKRQSEENENALYEIFHNSLSSRVRSLPWPINYTFLLFVGTAKPTCSLIAHNKRPPLLGTSRFAARKIKNETRRAVKKSAFKLLSNKIRFCLQFSNVSTHVKSKIGSFWKKIIWVRKTENLRGGEGSSMEKISQG